LQLYSQHDSSACRGVEITVCRGFYDLPFHQWNISIVLLSKGSRDVVEALHVAQ